jgi:uncharacterized membrane protein
MEATALVMAGFHLKSYAMRFFAWTLLGIVIVRLLFIDNYEIVSAADYVVIFNKRFLTFLVGVASLSVVYYLYSLYESLVTSDESKSKPAALFLLHLLLLWNLSSEVTTYFSIQKINAQRVNEEVNSSVGCRLNPDPSDVRCFDLKKKYNDKVVAISEKVKDVESKQNAVLNVLWSFYAIVLLAFGIRGKNRLLRLMGIGLLGIAIARLSLYGFLAMEGIYRVIAFIFIGVVLLAASFAYNEYKEKIKEIM